MIQNDEQRIEARRKRDMRTVSQMIALYCRQQHPKDSRTFKAHCGEAVCEECLHIDTYAHERTQRCRNFATKTTCDECPNHCYRKSEREQIKAIMRYSGPRMITVHPVAAIRHLLGK